MTQYITKRLNGIVFGFYEPEEIKKLSVKEITNPLAFDQINRPLINGLYDPALGVSPYEKFTKCITCGQEGLSCPGHIGHIQLILPVFNPFLMDKLGKILQSMCFSCHKLRLHPHKVEQFINSIILTKLGYITQCSEYEKACQNRFLRQFENQAKIVMGVDHEQLESDTTRSRINSQGDKSDKEDEKLAKKEFQQKLKQKEIKKAQKKIDKILKLLDITDKKDEFMKGAPNNQSINQHFYKIVQDVWDAIVPIKCPHCGHKNDTIKKEGYSKFFIFKKSEDEQNEKKKFIYLKQIKKHLKLLFQNESQLLSLMFGNLIINQKTLQNNENGYAIITNSYKMFFTETIPVPPNRFRPENKMNGQTFLHQHTVYLTKVLQINQELKNIMLLHQECANNDEQIKQEIKKKTKLVDVIEKWLEMQDSVNCFYDSTKAQKRQDKEGSGIKQLLEKKEGLFRMKMMGKRVNYAARSVISPDPNLDTREVGVPLFMAKKLTFPEYVNDINHEKLKQMIINGSNIHPGANAIEENGVRISLDTRTEQQRIAIAKTLLNNMNNKVVYRHLQTGDVLLFNRQPTLHKPSIMSHVARVLPKEQTIRMHYANCNSYNADFDGDEMNLHFLQSHQARAEAYYLSLNDKNYLVPKDGKPIRGLIQDSVFSAVFLTMKDTFLNQEEFQQLLYIATWNLVHDQRIKLIKPAIQKPRKLWTGKQLISNLLQIIVNNKDKEVIGLNMVGKSRIQGDYLGPQGKEETQIIIRDNELLSGIIDKAQVGNSDKGLFHAFFELYDSDATGKLMSAFAKMMSSFIQSHGFTCGVSDLLMEPAANQERVKMIQKAHEAAVNHVGQKLGLENYNINQQINLSNRPSYHLDENNFRKKADSDYISQQNEIIPLIQKKIVENDEGSNELDIEVKGILNQKTSDVLKLAKNGLYNKFPNNFFSSMVLTGAKGSMVNHNQVSLMLGQQELEGRRVPIMPSGKTLPSFLAYDPNPRSSGYITDRFLTGLRCQDFYFHCMAGREGLIDTAVKTSRSGYLQRCLIKHFENLTVNYDSTVRDLDGSIVQFYYGEDGIDCVKNSYLYNYDFIDSNQDRYKQKYKLNEIQSKLQTQEVKEHMIQRKSDAKLREQETIMNLFNPSQNLGAISERSYIQFQKFIQNQNKSLKEQKKLFNLINAKFFYSLAHPGEGVGATAAQSIGEPSTQMTLNTFHLAGHGGANVTLGIPRLREILMTATHKLKTPSMLLSFQDPKITERQATIYQQQLQKVSMIELVQQIQIEESKKLDEEGVLLPGSLRVREYKVQITFENLDAIQYSFGINQKSLISKIKKRLIPIILSLINKHVKKGQQKVQVIEQTQQQESVQDEEENDNQQIEIEEIQEIQDDQIDQKQKQQNNQQNTLLTQYFDGFKFKNHDAKIKLKVPLDAKKILMTNLIEKALEQCLVNEVKGINKSHLIKNDDNTEFKIQTEGVNFHKIWEEDFIQQTNIHSNDIQAIRHYYGIEAGRNSIIEQITSVFDVYHISVDFRHLALIADYMSYNGHIRALNRIGMNDHASALLRMSYETTMKFLIQASVNREIDNNSSYSSQIVLGRVPKVGTGIFDIRHQF